MHVIFEKRILGKYLVRYSKCSECGIIQTEDPYWLPEAYSSAIASTDVGLVARNRSNWKRLRPLLSILLDPSCKVLDVGGGYGLLCRGLRDDGFDCYTHDEYCENIFAKAFEPDENFKAKMLLAFEVLEHIQDPVKFAKDALDRYGSDYLVFSTLTYSGDRHPREDWWYYAFETGQHISIYSKKSLLAIANKIGMHYWSVSDELHVFSKAKVPHWAKIIIGNKLVSKIYVIWRLAFKRSQSKLAMDYNLARELARKEQGSPDDENSI